MKFVIFKRHIPLKQFCYCEQYQLEFTTNYTELKERDNKTKSEWSGSIREVIKSLNFGGHEIFKELPK